jgi:diguanylate cyclase (GGDEF)-like protein
VHPGHSGNWRSAAGWRGSIILSLLLLGLVATTAPARAAERWADLVSTVFQNFGREQGMPHPVPIALAQDGDGFLWVGTQGGLARWDGYRFRAYQPDPQASGSLSDSWIRILHADPQGRLWVGTAAGGLARYDPDHDRFVAVAITASPGSGRAHVGAIADDGAGGLWVGTEGGVDHLAPETAAITALNHDDRDPASPPDGKVQALLQDRKGGLWVGTGKGLARREAGSDGFIPVPLAAPAGAVGVTALFEDRDGRIWIGTAQQGVYIYDAADGAARPVAVADAAGSAVLSDAVSAICAASEHEIWVATRGAGIIVIDTVTGQTRRIRHDRTLAASLAHDDVWTLLQDRSGAMWAGGTGGLSYHPKGVGAVSTVFGASDQADGVTDADVYSVLPASDGRIWLGFLRGGADIVDPAAGRVAQLRPDPTRPETALPKDFVTAMAEGERGEIYLGTNRGLYRADSAGHGVALATVLQRDRHGPVYALLVDAGVLWVGGLDNGLWGIRLDGDAAPVFGPAESAEMADQTVHAIIRGRDQDLWIGTRHGLDRFDLATRVMERIPADPADPAALSNGFISSLLIDRQGRLWIGTFGGGISVMVGRAADGRPQFHRLGISDGLPHLNVDKLLLDAQGQVWAGTDDGLAVIDPESFAIRALHRAEGSVLADYFQNAGAADNQGELLFGAKGGLTLVRPERLGDWRFHPPVVVSDIRIGGVAVPSGRFNGAGSTVALVLTPETNSVAVEFSALDFSAPERNRYAYRLEGFDRGWIETDASRRLAAYTNLPPGSYSLHLRGSNRDGAWTERDLDIPIRVLPAWYQTLWFELAAMTAGLAAVVAIVRSRTAYLRRRQIELERQIAARTADLSAANERLFDLATTDPLTGCLSRRHFIERANDLIALSRRLGLPTSLVLMDLDEFKRINDTYGHPAGDKVLRGVGQTSRDHVRATDLLGRMGGEEFALLMPQTAIAGATLLADRLRAAIEIGVTEAAETSIRITASLGLAEIRPNESFDSLYARADTALYLAKERGRNRVVLAEAP